MRRYDFLATAARAMRRLGRNTSSSTESISSGAVGAVAAGMILAAGILAVTESRAPAVEFPIDVADQRELHVEPMESSGTNIPDSQVASYASSAITAENSDRHSKPADDEIQWFDNRPVRPVRTVTMLITAYSPDEQSCGEWADGITASGYSVWTNGMKLVAADTSILPLGSLVSVPGYDDGKVVPVLDRGGAIKGHRLDVLYPSHEQALQWGAQRLEVTIWEYADDKPNGFRQQH